MYEGPYDRTNHELGILVPRIHAAIDRTLKPYFDRFTGQPIADVKYVLISDYNMRQTITYVGLPRFMRDWSYGKQSQHWINQTNSHFFELVINTDPIICYHSINNRLPMHALVTAHAIGGHAVFFQLNRLFEDTDPKTVVKRFAQQDEKVQRLISDPGFGIERVEYIVDAARAVETHVPRVPEYKVIATEGPDKGKLVRLPRIDERQLRETLTKELRDLKVRINTEAVGSNFLKKHLEAQAWKIEAALKRHPIEEETDLLGFIMDPQNSPHLNDAERMLVSFVRDQSLYFQPQMRTKRMNEGFASYMEKFILLQPEVQLPYELMVDLSHYWTMHLKNPVAMYFDPYTCGLMIWEHIDQLAQEEREKQGLEDPEVEITASLLDRDDTGLLIETNEHITEKAKVHNLDKMMEVLRTHDDTSFTREFMTHELIEKINFRALEWVEGMMDQINAVLRRLGWSPELQYAERPFTLVDMLMQIQVWMRAAQQAAQAMAWYKTPPFPINPQILSTMSTILQIVLSYDSNKLKARRGMVRRGIAPSPPVIVLTDTGRYADGIWTLQHRFDEEQGPLLQSEARDTLARYKRLSPSPVQLVTMEEEINEYGGPTGNIVPYRYYTEDGETVLEGWI